MKPTKYAFGGRVFTDPIKAIYIMLLKDGGWVESQSRDPDGIYVIKIGHATEIMMFDEGVGEMKFSFSKTFIDVRLGE